MDLHLLLTKVIRYVDNVLPGFNYKIKDKYSSFYINNKIRYVSEEVSIQKSILSFVDISNLSLTSKNIRCFIENYYKLHLNLKYAFTKDLLHPCKDKRFGTYFNMFEKFNRCKIPIQILKLINLKIKKQKIIFIPLSPIIHEKSQVLIRKMKSCDYEIFPCIIYDVCGKLEYRTAISTQETECHTLEMFEKYEKEFLHKLKFFESFDIGTIKNVLSKRGFYPIAFSEFQIKMENILHLKESDFNSRLKKYCELRHFSKEIYEYYNFYPKSDHYVLAVQKSQILNIDLINRECISEYTQQFMKGVCELHSLPFTMNNFWNYYSKFKTLNNHFIFDFSYKSVYCSVEC